MSKTVNQLSPEDFGKTFDPALFAEWKKSVEAHEQAGLINIVLYFVGFAVMAILFGNILGVVCFFALAFIGIAIALPKQKQRNEFQKKLGISNSEFKEAIKKYRYRIK